MRNLPKEPSCWTNCPPHIKAKITQFETAMMEFAFVGSVDPADRPRITRDAQFARYNLEQTILTELKKGQ